MWYPRVDLAVEKGYARKGIWGGKVVKSKEACSLVRIIHQCSFLGFDKCAKNMLTVGETGRGVYRGSLSKIFATFLLYKSKIATK